MSAQKKVFNSRPLFYAFLALMLAIATSRFLFAGNLRYIIFDAVILAVFFIFCLWAKRLKILALVFCVFAFGLGWFFVGLGAFEGKTYSGVVEVVGRISDNINHSEYGGSATVVLKDVKIDGKEASNICLQIDYSSADEIAVGKIISFETKVEKVHLFTLGSMNSTYYRNRTPYTASISTTDCVVLGSKITLDERFRMKIKSALYENMGERNGAVAYAVLFGDKNDLDPSVKDAYKSAGIVHLLTVSGLHISFLIVLLGWLLRKCKVKGVYNFIVCALFLAVYSYLCNFSPSILRAGIMGLVVFSTKLCGKCYDGLSSLGLAGLIILIFSPLSALDVGFLMSFFCVLGIYVVAPILNKFFKKFLPKYVAEAFAISISVNIAVLPFLATVFSTANLLTFFVNLIVISIFSVFFPTLIVGALITALLPFFGFVLKACGWTFGLIENIANFFGETHLIKNLEPLDIFFVATFFVGMFLLSRFFMTSKRAKTVCCSAVFALSGIFYGLGYVQFPTKSSLVYGYGSSYSVVVLTNSAGESAIVDLGRETYTRSLLNALEIKSVSTLFVVQKPTILIDTADGIGVERVVRSDGGQGYDNEILVEFEEFGVFGGFSFVYRAHNNRLTGLEITFDSTTVFILKDWTTSQEAIASLPLETYDFVILGKHDTYAEQFDANSKILTYHNCSSAHSSFERNGNVSYEIDGEKYLRRCLD